jgi:hypothetical protein
MWKQIPHGLQFIEFFYSFEFPPNPGDIKGCQRISEEDEPVVIASRQLLAFRCYSIPDAPG